MIRPVAIAALAALTVLPTIATAGQSDPVINYENTDSQMNAAQAEARSHLDRFFEHVLDANGIGQQGSGVKVAFPIGENSTEVIWVSPFGIREGQLIGILANEPHSIEGMSVGDTVTFEQDQVRDWFFYGTDGKMYGSYTTRVMLADMAKDMSAQISEMLSNTPAPAGW